jgi:hypothetical protein
MVVQSDAPSHSEVSRRSSHDVAAAYSDDDDEGSAESEAMATSILERALSLKEAAAGDHLMTSALVALVGGRPFDCPPDAAPGPPPAAGKHEEEAPAAPPQQRIEAFPDEGR